MKVSKIEYNNFRNFKDHGEIICSTDGKVTIIYGKNGDGKTTLHQLCQWVFYGSVHFNKTTTDHLYNLQFEKDQPYGSTFDVMGKVDFEHNGEKYSLTRTYTYRKEIESSTKVSEDLSLLQETADHDWIPKSQPNELIEKLLPSGLSDYFFFDGESMIADLRVKGSDSAKKLKTALYSIFDLDLIEKALDHIGDTQYKTTALGKLYLSKGPITSGSDISAVKTNIENAQNRIEDYKNKVDKAAGEKKENQDIINLISEKIGSTKSKEVYEKRRLELKKHRDNALDNVKVFQSGFGDAVMESFPQLLMAKTITDATKKIHVKAESSSLPHGLSKRLIHYLTAVSTERCICGNPLDEEHKKYISHYLDQMPPRSYNSVYSEFKVRAAQFSATYDREKLENYIRKVIESTKEASAYDKEIKELDAEEKNSPDIEQLVVDRQKSEIRVQELEKEIRDISSEVKKLEIYLKKQMKVFNELTEAIDGNQLIMRKISILEKVKDIFQTKKKDGSVLYSKELQKNIQLLVDEMSTTKRTVEVSPEFTIKVYDSFNDESKSEGQFAIVSFAYIGGIFKLLQSSEGLEDKEYPLVLDGPFSKLDKDQRQNVIDTIPQLAPQVILFSKDDLQQYFEKDRIGHVWTLVSNDEKNVAHVEEGFLWK